MINLIDETITQGEVTENIKHFTTWWLGPFGFFLSLQEAKDKEADLNKLIPITVAISETMNEPVLRSL